MKNIFSGFSSAFIFLFALTVPFILQGCSSDSDEAYINTNQDEVIFEETGTTTIAVNSNESWTASLDPADSHLWLRIDPTSGTAGNKTMEITLTSVNNTTQERIATVNIKSPNAVKAISIKQKISYLIDLSATEIELENTSNAQASLILTTNSDWTANLIKDNSFGLTYTVYPDNGGKPGTYTFTFVATENNDTNSEKTADFVIKTAQGQKSIKIKQKKITDNYKDKDIVTLQQSTIGKGVNLLFMGDGFTQEMMGKGRGAYEKAMKQAMENFFSIEPYKSYRSYFNVYMIAAVSESSIIGNSAGNTAFKCYFGSGTLIEYDQNASMQYINHVFGNTNVQMGDITVGIILNSTKYAGTCTMWSHGLSISRVPMSISASPNNFKGLLQHEMGGHGFARVADEYIYNTNQQIPQSEINTRREWQGYGAYLNVDFTSNVSQVLWKDFIGLSKYSDVNVYEGGLTYGKGVWRPESNSCMNNNVPYYNAPTRWAAVKRIMSIAGATFSFEQFVQTDVIDKSAKSLAKSKAADRAMPPLHPPIMIKE